MNPLLRHPGQIFEARPGDAEILQRPLVDVGQLAIGRPAPDVDWQGVDKLLKLPLSFSQRLLRALLVFDVDRSDIPLHDRAMRIAQRFRTRFYPTVDAIFLAPAKAVDERPAGRK